MYYDIKLPYPNDVLWRKGMENPERVRKMRCLGHKGFPISLPKDLIFEVYIFENEENVAYWDDFSDDYGIISIKYFEPAPEDAEVDAPFDFRRYLDTDVILPPLKYYKDQTIDEIRKEFRERSSIN